MIAAERNDQKPLAWEKPTWIIPHGATIASGQKRGLDPDEGVLLDECDLLFDLRA
jgi:hypothetical protein